MGKFYKFIITALIVVCATASYADDDGNDNKPKFDVLSREASKTLVQLENFAETPGLDNVFMLMAFNNPDVVEVSLRRLDLELKSSRGNDVLVKNLIWVLFKFSQYPEYDKEVLLSRRDVLRNITARFLEQHSDNPMMKDGALILKQMNAQLEELHIARVFDAQRAGIDSGKRSTLRLKKDPGQAIIVATNEPEKFVSPAERLQKFVEYLDRYLIGQPEVKEALYDLEFEAMVKGEGNIKEPPFFMLMGLPGNGKDTAVETYIDALWGKRGAYREHMHRVDVQRSQADAWSLLGSAKGYVGSETLPEFVHFLVKHSGGKYLIKKVGSGGKEYEVVEAHPDWKPGDVLKGFYPPEKAAVFLNEFHDWSGDAKALILKQFLEKGIIKISGSGGGLTQLEIPGLRIFAATNEGISLITNRDAEGLRYGSPMEYDQMMTRHKRVAPNKDALKQEIARTALRNPPGTPKDQQLGTPEEIRNRTHPSRLILLEPLSPEQLKKIIRLNIEFLNEQYFDATKGAFGSFEIAATDRMVEFIQEYDYLAEDNARPMKDKVRALLEYPFNQGLKAGNFTPDMVKEGVTLDVKRNDDKTYTLIIQRDFENPKEVLWEQPIRYTFKERASEPITDEKIDHLSGIEDRLKDRLFGQPRAVKLVADAALLSEEVRHADKKHWNDHEKATSFAFLGPSSTGKSELAKAVVNEIYPEFGEERRVDIDFNKIQSEEDLREFIWGRKVGRDVQASEFMRKYDQFNGDILFVFEEGTNAPRKLLMSLYDLFRENHPKFADGKDRPMSRVSIIMTGNAGIKWYSQIPKDVPLKVQVAAWRMVYEKAMKNPEYQRATLEEYLPEPLINRIGQSNIVWFSPLDFQAIRELTILKLANNLEKLKESPGRRGWDVGFRNEQEKNQMVELIEKEGFYLHEQGASIGRYAEDQIQKGLRALLLKSKIPSGSRVVLVPRNDQSEDVIKGQDHVKVDVLVQGVPQPLELQVYAQKRVHEVRTDYLEQIITAAHEGRGHELVRRVLLGDKMRSEFITIIPGVTMIDGKWLYYLGLASSAQVEQMNYNRDTFIRNIAVYLAGYVAEQESTADGKHDAGKRNDTERATEMARNMVLKWGLEPEWGTASESVAELSESRKLLLEKLVKNILKEGEDLARAAIRANRDVGLEITRELARKGRLETKDLDAIYDRMGVVEVSKSDVPKLLENGPVKTTSKDHRINLIPELQLEKSEIADLDTIINRERDQQIAKARTPKQLPVFTDFSEMKLIDRVAKAVNSSKVSGEKQEVKSQAKVAAGSCKAFFK